jgi:twitching motility protein PilI
MSKRLNLREFQQSLSNRMQAKNRVGDQASTLGVLIAGQNWLIDMADISEVLPVPTMTRVPLSKQWFCGVANIRGNLYCIADIAAYLHKGTVVGDTANRVLIVAERHAFNAALLVDKVLGLRDTRNWRQSIQNGQVEHQDVQGISWRKLDVADLLNQIEFLQVGI